MVQGWKRNKKYRKWHLKKSVIFSFYEQCATQFAWFIWLQPCEKARTYFIWTVGSIAPSELQKHFCTISGRRAKSKSKLDIEQSCVLKSDVPYCFAYILAPLCCKEMSLNLKHAMSPLKWLICRVIMNKLLQYQILDCSLFQILEIWYPILFAYILVPWYCTEMFLHSRRSYGSHLLNVITQKRFQQIRFNLPANKI